MQIVFPVETICMKWQNLFSEKNKRKKKRFWRFMQIIYDGDNLHELSKIVFWDK